MHGKISHAPILSMEMLESASARPRQAIAYENVCMEEAAILLAEGIIRDHPFADGNKRVALLAYCDFLEMNGIKQFEDVKTLADMMIAIAEKKLASR